MYDIAQGGGDKAGRLPPVSMQRNETVTAFIQVTQEIYFDIRKLAQMAECSLNNLKQEVSGSNPGHSISSWHDRPQW